MRCSGLAQSRDTVPPISQRLCAARPPSGASNLACVLVAQITGWLGAPLSRVARELPFTKGFEFPQNQAAPSISRAMAQSFLAATWPEVSPKAKRLKFSLRQGGSELSFRRMTRGFPSAS